MALQSDRDFELPILKDDETSFRCPGESASISRSVHLARLEAGWPGCRDCVWNDTSHSTSGISNGVLPDDAIRRTSCGVRGAYLNAIDRFRAAQLGAILASHLARVSHVRATLKDDSHPASVSGNIAVAIGYDARHGAQDLFAGVTSAVLQNGCHVTDVGLCTTSSLLQFCRGQNHIVGCLMITGAQGQAGDVGIDVFGNDGRSLSIPWTDFGVGIRTLQNLEASDCEQPTAEVLTRWKLSTDALQPTRPGPGSLTPDAESADSSPTAFLQLPPLSESGHVFRAGRASGILTSVATEADYVRWVRKWWPAEIETPFRIIHDNPLTENRLEVLIEDGAPIEIRKVAVTTENSRPCFTVTIGEDDRFISFESSRRRRIPAEEMADWINRSSRTTASHVTAHPSKDGRQILLVDVAAPGSTGTHEIISDATAVCGFVATLASNRKNRLPV